jgi:hypothetical protein
MNSELKVRITEANLDVVDINGFKFNLHKMEVGNLKDFKILLPIFNDVSVGDCIVTTDWIITRLGKNNKPVDLCIRAMKFELVPSQGFEVSKYLNGKIVGMFLNSDKCYLRTVGPDAKPFYMATLKIKDSFKIPYEMLIVGFGNQAKKLSTVKKQSIIECEVTVKNRRDAEGYEFAVISLEVLQEVNLADKESSDEKVEVN